MRCSAKLAKAIDPGRSPRRNRMPAAATAADKITEKALEKSSGGKVDVDSKDGTVKLTDKDGNTSSYGTGTELPKGWPDESLNPPKSVTILASSITSTDGQKVLFVTAESSASATLYEGLKAQFEDAGYEITNEAPTRPPVAASPASRPRAHHVRRVVALAADTARGKTPSGTVATMNLSKVAG